MALNQAFPLSRVSQDGLIQYHKAVSIMTDRQWNLKEQMRTIDLAYLREQDQTPDQVKSKVLNNLGDANRIQNITVPVVKPQVNSAVDYQTSVFLTDYPIFGVVSAPAYISQAKQLQALIEENSIRTGWVSEFIKFFFDGFKYNFSALEVCWDKIVTAAIETDISYKGGAEGKPKEVIWQGNKVTRWDPYNTYFDSRCELSEIPSKGEFAGHTMLMSRTALKTFINSLDVKLIENIIPAFESPSLLVGDLGSNSSSYYIPFLNPESFADANDLNSFDWMGYVGLSRTGSKGSINYQGLYEVSIEYCRLMPADFNIRAPAQNTPQVWKLIIINHSVVIYAERQTNAHEKIPVFFGAPTTEGLSYQSKSLGTDATPFQQVASALMNSVLASRRRASTDRALYDPSRVLEAHINNPNPAAKIPVRPSAYGKPVGDAVYTFPFRDDQAGLAMQEIQAVVAFGNVTNGQNPVRQGQFVKGNKTDSQFQQSMSNATSKDQRIALVYEADVFTPLKEVLKLNYLQYQGGTTLYSPTQKKQVKIDPLELRNAVLNFKITDGLLPADKVISTDTLKVAMQVIGASPTLAQSYNIGPMFSYIMKTENVDLEPFEKEEEQLAYEQALGAWQQAAMLALQKGGNFSTPQPLPQQYGYNPATVDPEDKGEAPEPDETGAVAG